MNGSSVERALRCLGKGFDVTNDFQANNCKGNQQRFVIGDDETAELHVPGFGSVPDISADIKCGKGDRIRHQSNVLDFNQMSELFNQRCSLGGRIPSGLFNSMFGFNASSWAKDASETKYLAMDGYFISLFSLHIYRHPLSLSDHVIIAVPTTWDPVALTRFIKNFGTHIIVGLSMGGQDVMYMRQNYSSNLSSSEIKEHLDKLGDQLFTGTSTLPLHWKSDDPKLKGLTVRCLKRGGDTEASSHLEWLRTVPSMPDIINFTFIPITSLLKGVPGTGFLTHAINLYLRYKPPISDLQYFLDFQSPKAWGSHSEDRLTQLSASDSPYFLDLQSYNTYITSWAYSPGPSSNKSIATPFLQFSPMGPRLFVNTTQVIAERRPVTGMRLQLEGKKNDRLAIHLQHLSDTPTFLEELQEASASSWISSELYGKERFDEPVQWKKFSNVCTYPVEYDEELSPSPGGSALIVTGAQLHVTASKSTNVLHLRLLFSEVPGYVIGQSNWEADRSNFFQKSSFLLRYSTTCMYDEEIEQRRWQQQQQIPINVVDSGRLPAGPPVPPQAHKFSQFVGTSDICMGPQDSPGYWLVTGARLHLDDGKIGLWVKFSLLCLASSPPESEAV